MAKWYKILIARHGQSEWNKLNKFTGWYDSVLTNHGKYQASQISKKIRYLDFKPNLIFTSMQSRAINTSNIIINDLKLDDYKLIETYNLNERHYGALTGYNKNDITNIYGKQSIEWRKNYFMKPPIIDSLNINISTYNYPNYELIKNGESIDMTFYRSAATWNEIINMSKLNNVLVISHSNTIKSLLKNIFDINLYEFDISNDKLIILKFNDNLIYKIEII